MAIDRLDSWKTHAEAAEILKCSQRTIARMADDKKIRRVLRRIPGRKPLPVFNPDDIETLRAEMVQVEPAPAAGQDRKALALRSGQAQVDLFAQLLRDRLSAAPRVPVERKLFLRLEEATEYSGMTRARLLRLIKEGSLDATRDRGWKIRRSDLEQI